MLTHAELIDAHPDPEVPDSYYIEYDPSQPHTWYQGDQDPGGSEFGDGGGAYDDPGSVQTGAEGDWGEGGDYGGEGEDDDGEGEEDYDEEGDENLDE